MGPQLNAHTGIVLHVSWFALNFAQFARIYFTIFGIFECQINQLNSSNIPHHYHRFWLEGIWGLNYPIWLAHAHTNTSDGKYFNYIIALVVHLTKCQIPQIAGTHKQRRRTEANAKTTKMKWKYFQKYSRHNVPYFFLSLFLLTTTTVPLFRWIYKFVTNFLFSLFYETLSFFNFWFVSEKSAQKNREWPSTRGVPMNVTFETEQEAFGAHKYVLNGKKWRARIRLPLPHVAAVISWNAKSEACVSAAMGAQRTCSRRTHIHIQ